MKIALINFEKDGGYLPLATIYISGYLRARGFKDILIIDRFDIIQKLKEYKPDIIGIGVYSLTFYNVNRLAKEIKSFSNAPIIVGGPHVYCDPTHIERSNFDIGVVGEGEQTFYELIKLYSEEKKFDPKLLRKIDGLAFVNEKNKFEMTKPRALIKNLDDIPLPEIELLNLKRDYLTPGPAHASIIGVRGYLVTSRGCPYNCIYCSAKAIWDKVRWHSAERVVEEISRWINYGVTHINIYDDLMIANKPRLKKIIELLEQKNLLGKVDFDMQVRASHIDKEMCLLLNKLNVTSMAVGFETGSERLLKYLKGEMATIAQSENAINLLYKHGIKITGLIMIASPTETEEELKKTYEFAKNPKISILFINLSTPFPGTRFWDYAIEHKIIPKNIYETDIDIIPGTPSFDYILTQEMSKEKVIEYFNKFTELVNEKKNIYFPKFKLKHIKFFLSFGLLKKFWKRKKYSKDQIKYLLNSMAKKIKL